MRINIQLRESIENSIVNTNGNHVNVVTSNQRRLFNIEDAQLRQTLQGLKGREPNDVFVCSPTNPPLTVDLYTSFDWPQVKADMSILNARILEMSASPEIISTTDLVNNSSVGATFSANLSTTVTDTVSSNWQLENGISIGQSVSYSVGAFEGETSFEYTRSWGEGGENSRSIELSTGAGVEVFLEPGQAVTAQMISNRGHARVQVMYVSRLSGGVTMNYNPRHEGHHFWYYPVMLIIANSPPFRQEIASTENIKIGMYTSVRIEIRDKKTNRILKTFWRNSLGQFIPEFIDNWPTPEPDIVNS